MGQLYKGYIREILTKPWNDKTFYTIKLSTGDNVGFGSWPPKNLKEGDYIQVEAEKNKNGFLQADKKTYKVLDAPTETVSSGTSAVAVKSTAAQSSAEYWAAKEARDIKNDYAREVGASRNTAIEWIKFLVTQNALPMPTKKSDAEEDLNNLLNDYTKKFMISESKNNNAASANADKETTGSDGKTEQGEGSEDFGADWNA